MDLVQKARSVAEERYVKGKHHMFSALQTKSGAVFTGAHVEVGNGRISLCAEAVAIGAAAAGAVTAFFHRKAVAQQGAAADPPHTASRFVPGG